MDTSFTIAKINVGNGATAGVFNATMQCQDKKCYCYGKVCLVSDLDKGNCSAGNVFLNGRAFCGEMLPKDLGKAICQELGFQDVVEVNVKE